MGNSSSGSEFWWLVHRPFIIVSGEYHPSSWYRDTPLPPDWVISVSSNGWTTNEIGLDWIKHFDKDSRSRTIGAKHLLVLDGHETHHSADFEHYCKEHNIMTLCMPPHLSHILQQLDVGCFALRGDFQGSGLVPFQSRNRDSHPGCQASYTNTC